jgi:hypothetical protein
MGVGGLFGYLSLLRLKNLSYEHIAIVDLAPNS